MTVDIPDELLGSPDVSTTAKLVAGMLAAEPLKKIVLDKIASRVGMSGEEFDQWLNIPSVPEY